MNADGRADVAAIAFDGSVWVALSTGTGYGAAVAWGNTYFTTAANWFTNTYRQRVWIADVNNDKRGDVVGIDDGGDIHVYLRNSTGSAFLPAMTKASVFVPYSSVVGNGWFDPPGSANPNSGTRVWLRDVTGDGNLDFVGIGNAGDIWVSAFDPAASAGPNFKAPSGPFPSDFSTAHGWFSSSYRDRLFIANIVGSAVNDIIGVGFDGQVEAATGASNGTFGATQVLGNTTFGEGWFATSSQPRVFVGDTTGDSVAEIVGVAPNGKGNGDVWVARPTSSGWTQKVWLFESRFKTGGAEDWFTLASQQRVWLSDVTGDARADLVGIGATGEIWVARATSVTSTDASAAAYSFQPSLRVAQSGLVDSSTTNGFFSTSSKRRVWLADATGDLVNDAIAIAPSIAKDGSNNTLWGDGAILWTQALPTAVKPLPPVVVDGANHAFDIKFTRAVDCTKIGSSLTVQATAGRAVTLTPNGSPTSATTCPYTLKIAPAANGNDVKVTKQLEGLQMTDRWGQPIDGNGNGFLDGVGGGTCGSYRDTNQTVDYVSTGLLASASTVSIAFQQTTRIANPPDPPFPSATTDSDEPPRACGDYNGNGDLTDDCPGPKSRVVLLGNSKKMLVIISTELVGINPGRIRELITARTGIADESIIVTAAHTHGGNRTIKLYMAPTFDDRTYEGPSPEAYAYAFPYPYLQWIEDTIVKQVADAYAVMTPAQLAAKNQVYALDDSAPGEPPTGSVNRWWADTESRPSRPPSACDDPTNPDDHQLRLSPRLTVVAIRSTSGSNIAAIVNYPLHPVIASAELVGANTDFNGFLSRCLESSCAGAHYPTVLFVQSGAGDVNPSDVWYDQSLISSHCGRSTKRFPQRDLVYEACVAEWLPTVGAPTIARAKKYGDALGTKARVLAESATFTASTGMQIKTARTISPTTGISSCDNIVDCPANEVRPDGTTVTWDIESTVATVGPSGAPLFAFATLPGEPFQKLQMDLESGSALGANTMLFGYTNGYLGYLPDTQALQCVQARDSGSSACRLSGTGYCVDRGSGVYAFGGDAANGGFACYAAAGCFNGAKSVANGPVFFDVAANAPAQSVGEKVVGSSVTKLNQLIWQP